jgi:hypothetical protein
MVLVLSSKGCFQLSFMCFKVVADSGNGVGPLGPLSRKKLNLLRGKLILEGPCAAAAPIYIHAMYVCLVYLNEHYTSGKRAT